MKKYLSLFGLTIIVLLTAATANAATQVFTATLSGAQENPPSGSAGTGSAVVTLDTVTNQLIINVTFSGLTGNTTASHIHCCAGVGVNAGVATIVPTFPALPLGVTSGTFVQLLDLTQPRFCHRQRRNGRFSASGPDRGSIRRADLLERPH